MSESVCEKNPSSLNLFITLMLISFLSQISFLKALFMALLKVGKNMTGYFFSDCKMMPPPDYWEEVLDESQNRKGSQNR